MKHNFWSLKKSEKKIQQFPIDTFSYASNVGYQQIVPSK